MFQAHLQGVNRRCLVLTYVSLYRKGPSVEVAGCLATVLTASHALRGLSNPDLEETPGLATFQGLVELLADESKRSAVVDTLVCTQGVLPALARLVEVQPVVTDSLCMHMTVRLWWMVAFTLKMKGLACKHEMCS